MTDVVNVEELAAALFGDIRLLIHAARVARDLGDTSAAEVAALTSLKRAGESTSSGLARVEGISPQAMGVTVAALEARGLIARHQDPDDGRRVLLTLTEAGREVLAARNSSFAAAMTRALAQGFTEAELRTLRDAAPLLERLAEGF